MEAGTEACRTGKANVFLDCNCPFIYLGLTGTRKFARASNGRKGRSTARPLLALCAMFQSKLRPPSRPYSSRGRGGGHISHSFLLSCRMACNRIPDAESDTVQKHPIHSRRAASSQRPADMPPESLAGMLNRAGLASRSLQTRHPRQD